MWLVMTVQAHPVSAVNTSDGYTLVLTPSSEHLLPTARKNAGTIAMRKAYLAKARMEDGQMDETEETQQGGTKDDSDGPKKTTRRGGNGRRGKRGKTPELESLGLYNSASGLANFACFQISDSYSPS